jgi:hypothetical protein
MEAHKPGGKRHDRDRPRQRQRGLPRQAETFQALGVTRMRRRPPSRTARSRIRAPTPGRADTTQDQGQAVYSSRRKQDLHQRIGMDSGMLLTFSRADPRHLWSRHPGVSQAQRSSGGRSDGRPRSRILANFS